MNADEAIAYAQDTHRLALEAHEKAVELYDYVVPWRWPRWFRGYREVKRMMRAVEQRRDVLHSDGWGRA